MIIPGKAKIGAHVFTVKFPEKIFIKDDFGVLHVDALEIHIDRKAARSIQEETFIHEVVHALRIANGMEEKDDDEEEKICQILGHGIYQVLSDNDMLK